MKLNKIVTLILIALVISFAFRVGFSVYERNQYVGICGITKESLSVTGVDKAWKIKVDGVKLNGEGNSVCVIDTGVRYTDPDLGGEWGEIVIGGYNSIDEVECSTNHSACDEDGNVYPYQHGSGMARIIAANQPYDRGVSYGSKIVAAKFEHKDDVFEMEDYLEAIEWCIDNSEKYNITVLSMSNCYLSSLEERSCLEKYPQYENYSRLLQKAIDKNIVVVVAGGNSGPGICHPNCAAPEDVIIVGATNSSGSMNGELAWGPSVDVVAPGRVTSCSTPFVSGVVSLVMHYNKLLGNEALTPGEIKDILINTGDSVKSPHENDSVKEYPRVNVYNAVKYLE